MRFLELCTRMQETLGFIVKKDYVMAVHRSSRDIRRLPLSKNFGEKKWDDKSRSLVSCPHHFVANIYINV